MRSIQHQMAVEPAWRNTHMPQIGHARRLILAPMLRVAAVSASPRGRAAQLCKPSRRDALTCREEVGWLTSR
jgi:hypothetical protein